MSEDLQLTAEVNELWGRGALRGETRTSSLLQTIFILRGGKDGGIR